MKTFGFIDLESLNLPPQLLNIFSVLGIKEECKDATNYALSRLKSYQRIESLILIEPPQSLPQLDIIASYGCKIYSFFTEYRKVNLEYYRDFAKSSLVIIVNPMR